MSSNILIQGTLYLMLRLPSNRVRGEISLETPFLTDIVAMSYNTQHE
jgi:hypothetical protein